MPMKSIKEISEQVKKGSLFKNDPCQAAAFELYTFLDYKDLPEFFLKALSDEKIDEESWNRGREEFSYESITNDIREELSFLKRIVDAPQKAGICRIPRVLALFWIRGESGQFLDQADKYLAKLLAVQVPSKASINRYLKMLFDRV